MSWCVVSYQNKLFAFIFKLLLIRQEKRFVIESTWSILVDPTFGSVVSCLFLLADIHVWICLWTFGPFPYVFKREFSQFLSAYKLQDNHQYTTCHQSNDQRS